MNNLEQDIRQFILQLQDQQLKFLEKHPGESALLTKLMGGMAATTAFHSEQSKSEFIQACGEAWDSYSKSRNRS